VHATLRGRALQCGCCSFVSHNPQRRRAACVCTSVATAVASACGAKTSRLIQSDDRLGSSGGLMARGGLWGCGGAPRPGRPALSAQARADRPARSPRRCTCSGRWRPQLHRLPSAGRARSSSSGCPHRQCGPSSARRTSRRGRTRHIPCTRWSAWSRRVRRRSRPCATQRRCSHAYE
jgi:hypothetical protein